MIERCLTVEQHGWLALRTALWPHCERAEHMADMSAQCASPDRFAQFIAYDVSRKPRGLVEAALRSDYVNGTRSSPVAFLEGIYVVPEARRQGIARALVASVERWATSAGCTEFASDARLDNEAAHAMHRRLGFDETSRVVYFLKALEK